MRKDRELTLNMVRGSENLSNLTAKLSRIQDNGRFVEHTRDVKHRPCETMKPVQFVVILRNP